MYVIYRNDLDGHQRFVLTVIDREEYCFVFICIIQSHQSVNLNLQISLSAASKKQ